MKATVGHHLERLVEVVDWYLSLAVEGVEKAENGECCGSLGFQWCGRPPRGAKKLAMMRNVSASAEIDADIVNAVAMKDGEVVMGCNRVDARGMRRVAELYTEAKCLESSHREK